jgi:hypothetical protein
MGQELSSDKLAFMNFCGLKTENRPLKGYKKQLYKNTLKAAAIFLSPLLIFLLV